jgi:hypothetical protein
MSPKFALSMILLSIAAFSDLDSVRPENTVSVGPMFHWNFGKIHSTSMGLEISYWKIFYGNSIFSEVPFGLDLGIEYDFKKKTRLYSQFQVGYLVAGASLGPVYEFSEGKFNIGYGGSIWAGCFLLVDYRFVRISQRTMHGPALLLKIPVYSDVYGNGANDLF